MYKALLRTIHIIIFLFLVFLQAQEKFESSNLKTKKQITFHNLNVDNGLSQNSVVSIAQDSIGFMWFATQDGLNKFDGRSFKYFNKQFEDVTKLDYSRLGKIYIDKMNKMWIITNSGNLELYNPENRDFSPIGNLSNTSNLFQDSDLNYYVGTYGEGLFLIDRKTKDTTQLFKKEDQTKIVYDFLELNDKIIIATSNSVVEIKKNNFSYNKIIPEREENIHYSTLKKLKDNKIAIGTYSHGLFILNEKDDTFLKFTGFKNQPLPDNLNIESTLLDKYDRLWIATYGKGVYVINFEDKIIENYMVQGSNPYALHYNDCLTLFEDLTGNIWVGSDGGGLSYYDEHLLKFNVLTNDQLPRDVYVDVARAISVSPADNNIWVGTSGKGLTIINYPNKEFKTLSTKNSNLKSNRIMSLKHIDDELWIGYQDKGLDILDKNERCISFNKKAEQELISTPIWSILQTSEGNVWLGTGGKGLLLFNKSEGIKKRFLNDLDDEKTLTSNNIRAIIEGEKDILWIGTEDKGLCVFNTKTDQFSRIAAIPDKIKSLYYDEETHVLWIGTNGNGLKKFNPETREVKTYTIDDGLPNNVIYGIISDKNKNLWLSSNRGIAMLQVDEPIPTITTYDKYDGLQTLEFNTGAHFKDHKGVIYFGGIEGINWFKPDQLTLNPVKPKTIINMFYIFDKHVPLSSNNVFEHDENTMSIGFSSLHFSQPNLNNFKYILENYDKDWSQPTNRNSAYYSNLLPGTYTFKVMSSNYDGIWNETPAEFTFTIKKAWYNTNLAQIIYVVLGILTIILIYRYFKWRWYVTTKLRLEHAETKRLKKLDKFKSRLYSNLSHEFRTPLTLISGPIENQLNNPRLTAEDRNELNMIKRNSKRLLNLVDQLLDLSKLESGNYKLAVAQGNINTLLKQIIAAFEFKAREKTINYKIDLHPLQNAYFDKDILEKVVTNLLSNATKYTPVNGDIFFNTKVHDGKLIISVVNTCNDLKKSEVSKLFKRYYQKDKNIDGVGVGLNLVKELCTLSHGNIVAHAITKNKIQFTVTLPIDQVYYSQHEISNIDSATEITNAQLINLEIKPESIGKTNKDKPILLIVEDDSDVRIFIASIFKNVYQVNLASNGKEGITMAKKLIPDIVISDVMMPKIDGIKLCKVLKGDEKTSHIPIILLTAKSGDESEIKGLKTGADDYIVKPFNSEKLKIKVETLIKLRKQLQKRYSASFELNDIVSTSVDEKFFKKLKTVLDNNITNPDFNAEDLSKEMLMSRMQLHRKLKSLTSLSTSEFIRTERLKLAKTLLQQNNATISEIAYKVGFNSPSYFIKSFKSIYKCTPTEFQFK